MRILLMTTCLANIAFAFGMVPWMPNPMANHFALDGTPDGFMSPVTNAVIMSVVVVVVGAAMLVGSWLMAITPPQLFNIPNRDYWLNEENRPKTIRRICSSVELIGTGTMLFILFLQWELFRANLTVPPKLEGKSLWLATGVLLVVIAVDTVRLLLAFRLPKENKPKENHEISPF